MRFYKTFTKTGQPKSGRLRRDLKKAVILLYLESEKDSRRESKKTSIPAACRALEIWPKNTSWLSQLFLID